MCCAKGGCRGLAGGDERGQGGLFPRLCGRQGWSHAARSVGIGPPGVCPFPLPCCSAALLGHSLQHWKGGEGGARRSQPSENACDLAMFNLAEDGLVLAASAVVPDEALAEAARVVADAAARAVASLLVTVTEEHVRS